MTAGRLERSYRRLLLAYPRSYRRRHGAEILTTLLEMAAPDQRGPHRADAWHLVASGIRQRLRLPARRPLAVVGAVLTTLILAGFGAAFGSWLGWQPASGMPHDAALRATARAVGEAASAGTVLYYPAQQGPTFRVRLIGGGTIEGRPWRLERLGQSARPKGGRIADVMAANGWRRTSPAHSSAWEGVRDGVRLTVDASRPAEPMLTFSIVQPAVVRPLVIGTAVLGGALGWLLAAAVAQRSRGRRAPALLWFAAVVALALPTSAIYNSLLRMFRTPVVGDRIEYAVHMAFAPEYYPFGPEWQVLGLSVAGGLLALAAVTVAYLRPPAVPQSGPVVQVR